MSNGNPLVSKPAPTSAPIAPAFDVTAFAQLLLNLPNVREVKAALNAILLEVECTARNPFDGEMEATGDELDSGTWFFVRVSDLPAPDATGGLVAFVREDSVGGRLPTNGNDENGSGHLHEA